MPLPQHASMSNLSRLASDLGDDTRTRFAASGASQRPPSARGPGEDTLFVSATGLAVKNRDWASRSLGRTSLPADPLLSPSGHGQEGEVRRLAREVAQLRDTLSTRPTHEDMDRLRAEWQTSEELFAQSQKDNEQKHVQIEALRHYIKALESKLEETLGEGWKEFCVLPSPHPPSIVCGSSTPLPKPGALRSASIKRARRHSRGLSLDSRRASDLMIPTNALRKLDEIKESASSAALVTSDASGSERSEVELLLVKETSVGLVTDAVTGDIEAAASATKESDSLLNGSIDIYSRQATQDGTVSFLLDSLKSLPSSIVAQLGDQLRQKEREHQDMRELQRQAILDALDAAERRSDAREERLGALLLEARSFRPVPVNE